MHHGTAIAHDSRIGYYIRFTSVHSVMKHISDFMQPEQTHAEWNKHPRGLAILRHKLRKATNKDIAFGRMICNQFTYRQVSRLDHPMGVNRLFGVPFDAARLNVKFIGSVNEAPELGFDVHKGVSASARNELNPAR